jgi:hypothetical protein
MIRVRDENRSILLRKLKFIDTIPQTNSFRIFMLSTAAQQKMPATHIYNFSLLFRSPN